MMLVVRRHTGFLPRTRRRHHSRTQALLAAIAMMEAEVRRAEYPKGGRSDDDDETNSIRSNW
jgi:hypothetical protein